MVGFLPEVQFRADSMGSDGGIEDFAGAIIAYILPSNL
jgi:hypothetical protein